MPRFSRLTLRHWLRWRFAKRRVLLVMRLADMVRVHPQMDRNHVCAQCAEPVGVYPSGQQVLQTYRRVRLICNHCAPPQRIYHLAPGAFEEPLESRWSD